MRLTLGIILMQTVGALTVAAQPLSPSMRQDSVLVRESLIADSSAAVTKAPPAARSSVPYRVNRAFYIGEKAKEKPEGVIQLKADERLNAFSFLEVRLRPEAVDSLGKPILALVVDVKRRGEVTWNRVVAYSRYSRRVRPTSDYTSGKPETLAQPIRPLYIKDAILAETPFLREGDVVLWLPFRRVSRDSTYLKNLLESQEGRRPLLTLDLQELYLHATGSVPEPYAVKHGDTLRLQFLRLECDPRKEEEYEIWNSLTKEQDRLLARLTRDVSRVGRVKENADVLAAIDSLKTGAGGEFPADTVKAWKNTYAKSLNDNQRAVFRHLMNDGRDSYEFRFADTLVPDDQLRLPIVEFGFKLNVMPVIALGRRMGADGSTDDLNPIKRAPSAGSNLYLTYDGRSGGKKAFNWLPGMHLSLLGLGDNPDVEFTLGIVHPLLPDLRANFGVFLAWYDLKDLVWGFTFSPKLNFQSLVKPEKTK